ncbi:MAG: fumarate hydratase, partial [Coriobacteriales bacterium]|nr:fumarate hydratase [Coriobacteriales bacterium]
AANACPPLLIGVGVGGSFDKVAGLSKQALLREIDGCGVRDARAAAKPDNPDNPDNPDIQSLQLKDMELELLRRINELGIGPGGLGGDTTALAVHINTAPCHIAALPVAVNLGCCAQRSVSFYLEIGD